MKAIKGKKIKKRLMRRIEVLKETICKMKMGQETMTSLSPILFNILVVGMKKEMRKEDVRKQCGRK